MSELAKSHHVPETLEELMRMTYPNRRSSILSGEFGLLEVCEKFPLLRKPKHLSSFISTLFDACCSLVVHVDMSRIDESHRIKLYYG